MEDTNGYNYQMQNLKDLHKIAAPNLPSSIVHRTHLVRKIQEVVGNQVNIPNQSLYRKLLLLCAPAGYGKTTLLADFSLHASMPCCWYFLDETDNDQMIFLQRITRSIRSCFSSFCPSLEEKIEGYISSSIALKENSFALEELVDLLIESMKIEIPDRFLLFLCNYHEVNANPILQRLMARFLKRLPASCFLVIESRAVPTLEFAPLLWKQEMVGMGMEALKFTSQEIIELASQQNHGVLAEEDAKTLVDLFDGWITGILLGTQLGDQYFLRENSFFLDQGYKVTKPLRQKQLFAYLANEIFQRQPELCSLLEEAAIFQHIIPDVYANLVQRNDIEAFLYQVEEKGLFMNHHGEGVNVVFSLHPVLRMYLQDELKQHNPVKYRALHCTAVQLWFARYNYDQAMYHAQIIEDHPLIERIILQAHEQLLSCGRLEMLIQWVEVLLSISQVCHPKILLLRAQISLLLGDYVEALLYVEQAQKRFTQFVSEHGEEIPSFQEQMNLLQARIFFRAGEYKKTLVICQQFVEKAPSDEEKMLAEAHVLLGICTTVMGDFNAGILHLQRTIHQWGVHMGSRRLADIHSMLASTYSLIGNFALAEYHVARVMEFWDMPSHDQGKVNMLIRIGLIKQRQGLFTEAETLFYEALDLSRGILHFSRGEAYSLTSLGELYQDMGKYGQSLKMTEDGLILAKNLKEKYIINCSICTLAMTYVHMGDTSTAQLLILEMHIANKSIDQLTPEGYESILYSLTHGTILLMTEQYSQALEILIAVEVKIKEMHLKREGMQVSLRIALCQLLLRNTLDFMRRLGEIETLVRDSYKQLVLVEIQKLPLIAAHIITKKEFPFLQCLVKNNLPDIIAQEVPNTAASFSYLSTITSHPQLKIIALGEPVVQINEVSITRWRMARTMELLFFLLYKGNPVHKEQIIDALWPEASENIDQTFRSTMYYLRKTLGDSCVISHAGTYRLDLASQYQHGFWYDVSVLHRYAQRAQTALAEEHYNRAKDDFQEILNLYRGDYVQSFYNNWCFLPRQELCTIYLDARHQLAKIYWREEQYDECIIHWQRMLSVDICLEEAHAGLIRCYLRQGKRSLAMRQYQHCIEALQAELSIQPGPIIQNLYQHIKGSVPRSNI